MSSHISAQFHKQKTKKINKVEVQLKRCIEGCLSQGVVFSSPPVLPTGQEGHAESLLHHHLRVVLFRPSRSVCHHGEGQNVL